MKTNRRSTFRAALVIALMLIITIASSRLRADTGTCGGATITLPFTDVPAGNVFFCSIAEAYFSALTNGTSPTTYSPGANVNREQMAAFITRTMDQSLKRGSRRAALKQFWTPTLADAFGRTAVGAAPQLVESDGADLWVANSGSDSVSRVRASDGKVLGNWTGAVGATGVLAAKGAIFVTGRTSPGGSLYYILPDSTPGAVSPISNSLGNSPLGISFDGARIWTANHGVSVNGGSVSIIDLLTFNVTTVTAGFIQPIGILYDGANIWVTDFSSFPGRLFKLNSSGAIVQTVEVGSVPGYPVFDGTNIWVPNTDAGTVTVVRASTGAVLATLTGNGLSGPTTAAFDGERILVTNSAGAASRFGRRRI